MKTAVKYTGIVLLSLLLLAFLIPLLFKGKIVQLAKTQINKTIAARVEFSDVSLSLFRHFPKLSIGFEDISVAGVGEFEKDTLLSASRVDAAVNLWSLIRGSEMKVYGVYLQSPRIHALVDKNGKANWEITKPDTGRSTGGASAAVTMKLEKYGISNGYIFYRDESSGMQAEIKGLEHEGSGDLTGNIITLATRTKAETASFNYGGIPYLVNARAGIDADLVIDNGKSRYSFKNATIGLNNLKLTADGFMQIDNDSTYSMDIKFDAGASQFKNFLSLVPSIYRTDFEKLKTAGTAAFKGFVKGSYSPTRLPAYSVDLDIKDGFFQYPDLPQPVKNVNITMRLSNEDGVLDHTVANISKGHLDMGNEPFDFRLLFKNPETSQYMDAAVKGRLNLSNVGSFVKLPEGTKLSGLVSADAFVKGNLSAIQSQKGDFAAGGFLAISNLYYASKDFPQPIQNGNFKIELQNSGGMADATTVNVSSGHIEVGGDPFDFSLKLSNPVSAVNFSGTAKGRFSLDHTGQFTQLPRGTSLQGVLTADISFSGSKEDIDRKNYERINTTGIMNLRDVRYVSGDYPEGVSIQSAQFRFNPQNIILSDVDARFRNTHLTADGVLDNMIGYALHNQELKGTFNLTADKVMLNDWMGTTDTATASTTASVPFPVPAHVNATVNARASSVQYDKVTYSNVRGTLLIKDEAVRLQNVQTDALDGTIVFNGSYSTLQNKMRPDIDLSYDVRNIDIQKAFLAYNTMQKLMPLGKFLSGKLSSQFSMSGKLDEKMYPDLNSLTGNGSLLLVQGVLSRFQPLDKLASALDVSELKDVSMKDVKSHFEFANGKVLIKPFNLKVKDIDMQVGGMHGLDQTIDYLIGMKLPRKYLGAAGNAMVSHLATEASSRGLPVTLSEVIDLNIKMGGSITNPVVKTDLKQAGSDMSKELKAQATAFVQQKTEEASKTLRDTATAIKNQVVRDAKAELLTRLTGEKDSTNQASLQDTKQKTVETVKNTLGGLFKRKKTADSTKTERP